MASVAKEVVAELTSLTRFNALYLNGAMLQF